MDRLCRVCLASEKHHEKLKNFFEPNRGYAEKLYFLTSISVFEISGIQPALICNRCCDNLTRACKIKKLALDTDAFFKEVTKANDLQILTDIIGGRDYTIIKEDKTVHVPAIKEDPDAEYLFAEYIIEEDPAGDIEELVDFNLDHSNIKFEVLCLPSNTTSLDTSINHDSSSSKSKKKKQIKKPRAPLKKIWPCESCEAIFPSADKLNQHKRKHITEKNFSCDQCGKMFKCSSSIRRHKEVFHDGIKFTCDLCGKHFRGKLNIYSHMKIHMKSMLTICHLCGKILSKPKMLQVHMLYSHGGKREFECPTCNKAFFTKNRLKQHEANHGERPWVCEICSRDFAKRYKLGEHMKQRHRVTLQTPKRHACTLCGVDFDRKQALQNHLRDKHDVAIEDEVE